ncbi:MAG: aminotransferase class V-fold PLP-dependent enzyme, partial [Simkaniaceae bacterium]|nr:aminotransferase class V-fold PLP-dependent enzyme [Simkaniaceae bacterium]
MSEEIYLDNNVNAKPSSHVLSQMQPFIKRHWKSTLAPYIKGKEPFTSISRQTENIKNFLGAASESFVFTSSGAEAIAHVFQSVYIDHIYQTGKTHLVSTNIEDAPILMSLDRYEKLDCVPKKALVNAQGMITKESIENCLSPRTGLVSLSFANGLTGVIQPIEEISALCTEQKILLHVDVTNVLGKLDFKASDYKIDFITFGGSALHAPKGTGGLIHKGNFGPFGNFGEEVNAAELVGLGIAIGELEEHMDQMGMEISRLRNLFEEGISTPHIFFQEEARLPNISAFAFPGISAELLAYALSEQNIFVSFGGGNQQKLEYLLIASG